MSTEAIGRLRHLLGVGRSRRGTVLGIEAGVMRVATRDGVEVAPALDGVRAGDIVTLLEGRVIPTSPTVARSYEV